MWVAGSHSRCYKRVSGQKHWTLLLPCTLHGVGREGPMAGQRQGPATALSPRLSPDFMNVYYQIRSSQLDRSLKGLKEYFRKSSCSSGVPYSPAIPNKRKDTPTKKPTKRPGEPPPQPEGCVGPALLSAALGLAVLVLQSLSSR